MFNSPPEWPEPIVRVQSLSERCTESIPDRYIKPPTDRPSVGSSSSCDEGGDDDDANIPIINLGGLCGDDPDGRASVLRQVSDACNEWGFFQILNHGVSPDLMDKARETWRQFFHLPMEVKQQYANSPKTYEGYGSRLGVEKGAILDWSDYYFLHYLPLSLKDYNKWPASPPSCRPGWLEVQAETSLPDENGRLQILQIRTNKMKENSFLAPDVNLQQLAARTKNYSGAELEGVVRSAVSYALYRQLSLDDLTKPVEEENVKVTMEDFLNALQEVTPAVTPAFGASTDDLEKCRPYGMVDCGDRHKHIYRRAMLLVEQVKGRKEHPLGTCLLEGSSGSGKTALAATVGIDSNFPYVKIVSAESMMGLHESTKCEQIVKVFEDAYKSPLSVIILDDIERLLEYASIGPQFSNSILQTLLLLLKRVPPKGKKLMVIGTTSELDFLESVGFSRAFSVTYHVPTLNTNDAKKLLEQLNLFADEDIDSAAEALDDVPISMLYTVIRMAAQGEQGGSAEAIYSGKEKINISHFYSIVQEVVRKY